MKKSGDNSKYFLIGIVALVLVVILLDTRYTGYQVARPDSNYLLPVPATPDMYCIEGCRQLRDNVAVVGDYVGGELRDWQGFTAEERYNLCVAGCPGHSTGYCGDGTRQSEPVGRAPEECDDGPWSPIEPGGRIVDIMGDGCYECKVERCGDGRPQPNEECEDGNTDDHDGCSHDCKTEPIEVCGRGEDDENTEYICNGVGLPTATSGLDFCENDIGIRRYFSSAFPADSLLEYISNHFVRKTANSCRTPNSERVDCLCWRGIGALCKLGEGNQYGCSSEEHTNAFCMQYLRDFPPPYRDGTIVESRNNLAQQFCASISGGDNGFDFRCFCEKRIYCGNGLCDVRENSESCPQDCSASPLTGADNRGFSSTSTQNNYPSTNTPYTIPSTYDSYGNPSTTAPSTDIGGYPMNTYSTPDTSYTAPTTYDYYGNPITTTDTSYTAPTTYDSYGNPITPYTTTPSDARSYQPTYSAGNYMAPPNPMNCGNGICDIGTQYTLPEDSYSCPQDCQSLN